MSIKAVFFDAGGVLHTSRADAAREKEFIAESRALLAKHGVVINASDDEYMAAIKARAKEYKQWSEQTTVELPAQDIWTRYFLRDFAPDPQKTAGCAEKLCYLYDGKKSEITARPHLLHTVEALHKMGVRQGVISNIISRTFIPECVQAYGIAPYMECVIMSSVVGRRKPAREIFEAGLGALGFEARDCAFVGDRLSRDIIGARQAGFGLVIQIFHAPSVEKDRALESLGYAPDVVIHDLAEIPGVLTKRNKERTDV